MSGDDKKIWVDPRIVVFLMLCIGVAGGFVGYNILQLKQPCEERGKQYGISEKQYKINKRCIELWDQGVNRPAEFQQVLEAYKKLSDEQKFLFVHLYVEKDMQK